ncbi:putative bifunctional diguanylate cyclase/phosphodiesterase [Pleionea litopenaei]|uniref:Bifunctional diguanylate cyclase/phosphodiesterase n=1 Tax=Pleionea litopenaei TaxID=3070815 RepID=A0AA51X6S1_9GAMM|nr:bifunctional diguanylate cyclase/phosphodiesterase [Pleionea sp. HL-JVS1]WMS87131.1 bifunctional diguanylate cyclase/phosphodiesterase [Pleionea sp. HL-JVS1]
MALDKDELTQELQRLRLKLKREKAKREQLEQFAELKTRELFLEKEKTEIISEVISATSRTSDVQEASSAIANLLIDAGKIDSFLLIHATGYEYLVESSHRANTMDFIAEFQVNDSEWSEQLLDASLAQSTTWVRVTQGMELTHLIHRISTRPLFFVVLSFCSKQKLMTLDYDLMERIEQQLAFVIGRHQDLNTIYQMSHYDPLTQLCSKDTFLENLTRMLEHPRNQGSTYALVVLDVVGMNVINSQYSLEFGNRLLKHVASEIAYLLRQQDSLTRYSGNCFAFYLHSDAIELAVTKVLERIEHRFDKAISWDGHNITIRFNCGYMIGEIGLFSAEKSLHYAEIALKNAKQQSTLEPVMFEEMMLDKTVARYRLDSQLRDALARKEFSLFYQPIVDLESKEIVGAEALMRWHPDGPTGVMVSPVEFIPLLEENDLILPVGRWLVEQALEDLTRWQGNGHSIQQISVNLSAKQFHDQTLLEFIESTLNRLKVPASCLMLEVTESLYLDASENVDRFLASLSSLGISIALDDFGTGYSSLSYLYRYPIQKLKIDRAFVTNLDKGDKHIRLLQSIIALSRSLEMKSVAEGIETETVARLLQHMGVDYGQGFFYSRPINAQQFEQLLGESSRQ